MDIQRWKELLMVLECGSLTLAAERLGYTLSTISRSMSTLEKEEGYQLLYRSKKGVTPTKEYMQILPYVREVCYAAERFKQASSQIRGGEEGEIHIGTAYRHYYRWLTEVTSEFHSLHPGITFRIYHGTSSDFSQQLSDHRIDFCLISQREGEHEWYPICKDPLIALLPAVHPLAGQEVVHLEDFKREPYVATCPGLDIDSSRFFRKYHVQPNIQFSTMDIQATYAMVDAGLGISITNQINSLDSYPGVCHRPVIPTDILEIGLACEKDLAPACRLFLEFLLPRLP